MKTLSLSADGAAANGKQGMWFPAARGRRKRKLHGSPLLLPETSESSKAAMHSAWDLGKERRCPAPDRREGGGVLDLACVSAQPPQLSFINLERPCINYFEMT